MTYEIRKAKLTDREQILRLAREVTSCYTRKFMGDELTDWFIDSGACDDEILQNYEQLLVMLDHDTMIGLMIWKDNLMELLMIALSEHGSGAAQYFCNQVIPEKLKQFGTIKMECFEENVRANCFYRKMGWMEYDRITDESIGKSRILYCMKSSDTDR